MKFDSKYGIGDCVSFHPFGKTNLTSKAVIRRIIINGSVDGFSVEYVATDDKNVDWSIHEDGIIETS